MVIETISLAASAVVLAWIFRKWDDIHSSSNNDKPYYGPVHSGTKVLHPDAHIVIKGKYRALIDFNGFRWWIPYCGYTLRKWDQGLKVDPLVFRQVQRGN